MGIIYLIRNKVENKVYVGKTSRTLSVRWAEHLDEAFSGCPYRFHQAIRNFGKDAFELVELYFCSDNKELDEQEKKFIKDYSACDTNFGYNMQTGGQGGTLTVKRKMSEEAKEHLRQINLGKKASLSTKLLMSQQRKGKTHNEQWRNNISKALKGKTLGRKDSEELKQRKSAAQTRRHIDKPLSKEIRAIIGIKNRKPRNVSPEGRARLSKARLGRTYEEIYGDRAEDMKKKVVIGILESNKRRHEAAVLRKSKT